MLALPDATADLGAEQIGASDAQRVRARHGAKRRAWGGGGGRSLRNALDLAAAKSLDARGNVAAAGDARRARILIIGAGILILGMKPMLVITMRIPWLLEASRPHTAPLHPAAITMESAHTAPQAMLA